MLSNKLRYLFFDFYDHKIWISKISFLGWIEDIFDGKLCKNCNPGDSLETLVKNKHRVIVYYKDSNANSNNYMANKGPDDYYCGDCWMTSVLFNSIEDNVGKPIYF